MPSCRFPAYSEIILTVFAPVRILYGILLAVNLLTLAASDISGQSVSYPEIFGSNWNKAIRYVEENQEWMQKTCRLFRVDYALAVSVVFPELIRYSALRDKMEITLMKALYTHKGSEYADFSVGVFQMKPSCAEALLDEFSRTSDQKLTRFFNRLHHSLSGSQKRALIMKELEDPAAQFIYVAGMIRLLDKKYEKKPWKDVEEKVKFYAAAYNSGFNNPENRITEHMSARYFHTGPGKPAVCYSYAAISAACYHSVAAGW